MPLTFGETAGWYRNIRAAGWCVVTWRGGDHTVTDPVIVDRAAALPAFPGTSGWRCGWSGSSSSSGSAPRRPRPVPWRSS